MKVRSFPDKIVNILSKERPERTRVDNVNLAAFSQQWQHVTGQVFAVFVIAVAAAEAAVGLGIILAFYRNKETVNIDEMNVMRW